MAIDIEELVSLPIFYSPVVSWDKSKVAFYWNKTDRHELYVRDIETREIKQVSKGQLSKTPMSNFVWSRDDRYIVTGIDVGGNEQHDLYAFDLEVSEFFEVTKSDGQNYPGDFSPDNKKMLVLSTREKQRNLYISEWETKEIKRLTDFDNPVEQPIWAKDSEWIYFMTNESKDLRNQDIYRVRPDGSGLMRFLSLEEGSKDLIQDISPNNLFAAILSDFSGFFQAGIMDLKTKEIRWLGDGKHEEFPVEFSPTGELLLTLKDINAEIRPEVYEVRTGKRLDLNLPKGCCWDAQFTSKNKIFLTHSDPTHRERMFLYDIEKGTYEAFQEAEYRSINPQDFSDAECVKYNSKDGTEIEAILYKPRSMKHGWKVPAVVFVHGGPESKDLLLFSIYAQCIASLGFGVLQPNFRGSIGYGKKFREVLIKDWGGKEAEDIAWGVEYLKKLDWIDQDRIAVAGGSYGGYASYWQMVKYPELWKAGIAWIGVTDLLKMYEESQPHFKYFLRESMGDPEKDKELWIDRSPITHAKNFKGPLLMIQGVNDPRCPVSQARIFRDKLTELEFKEGKDFEYHELGEEGHGSLDKEQRIKTFKLMTDFLKRRLI